MEKKVHWTAWVSSTLSFWLLFWGMTAVILNTQTFIGYLNNSRESHMTLNAEGMITSVVEKTKSAGRYRRESRLGWEYEYTYIIKGRSHEGRTVDGLRSEPFKIGDEVAIVVDPKYPKLSRIEDTYMPTSLSNDIIYGVITLLGFLLLARSAKGRLHLLRHGKFLTADVTSTRSVTYRHKGVSYTLTPLNNFTLTPRESIQLLYLPESPKKALIPAYYRSTYNPKTKEWRGSYIQVWFRLALLGVACLFSVGILYYAMSLLF